MTLPAWLIVLGPLAVLLGVVFFGWRYLRRGTTAVHRAASCGDVGRLRELLLAAPQSVHAEDLVGLVPLQYAAHWGQLEAARLLLAHGAEANRGRGPSPLHYAALEGHAEIVDLLLDHGAAIDAKSPEDDSTPLQGAVIRNRLAVVRRLLERGAAADARTKSDWTACHFAAADGRLELMRTLLDFGADWQVINAAGQTPLELALANGHREIAELVRGRVEGGRTSTQRPSQNG